MANYVSINGKRYTSENGDSISVNGNVVTIGGKRVDLSDDKSPTFNIVVHGDVDTVSGEFADITIEGSGQSVRSDNGNVKVMGDVSGSVSSVNGDVKVAGGVGGSVTTVNGDIRH